LWVVQVISRIAWSGFSLVPTAPPCPYPTPLIQTSMVFELSGGFLFFFNIKQNKTLLNLFWQFFQLNLRRRKKHDKYV
jgi:hypothetical protein